MLEHGRTRGGEALSDEGQRLLRIVRRGEPEPTESVIRHRRTTVHAATAPDHLASQAVLTRAGFVGSGTVQVDARPELRFVRDPTVDRTGRPADR